MIAGKQKVNHISSAHIIWPKIKLMHFSGFFVHTFTHLATVEKNRAIGLIKLFPYDSIPEGMKHAESLALTIDKGFGLKLKLCSFFYFARNE
jgi:hypothetical protein